MKKRNYFLAVCACLLCTMIVAQLGFVTVSADDPCTHPSESLVVIPGVSATCGEDGLTAGFECGICGEVVVPQTVVPATGKHTPKTVTGKKPTCGEPGLTDGFVCSVCDVTIVAQEPIEATGKHTPKPVAGKKPTCGEAGLTDGFVCADCGTVIVPQTEISPTGEHTPKTVEGTAPTCTEPGLTDGSVCSVCGELLVAQEIIIAEGHKEVVLPAVEGDCLHPGLTEGKACSVCGEILVPQQNLGLGKHNMENGVCTVCGYQEPGSSNEGLDDVPKTGDITGTVLQGAVVLVSLLGLSVLLLKRKLAR